MSVHNKVVTFIERFKKNAGSDYSLALEDAFLNGNCYWFAQILMKRFRSLNPILCYLQIEGHFVVKLENRYYDIAGEKILEEKPYVWEELLNEEPNLAQRIYRNCALLEN